MRVDITNFFEDFYENLANFRPREGTNCRQYAVIREHKSAIFELEPLYSSENLCQIFLNSSLKIGNIQARNPIFI